jgi:hypothetical protein
MISVEMLNRLYEAYDRPCFTVEDFEEDAMRIVFVSRLLSKYHRNRSVNVRLLLNHIVVLRNVFGSLFIEAVREEITVDTSIYFNTILHFLHIEYSMEVDHKLLGDLENVRTE